MNRIPSYLVTALLGLAFISAGLITMFADTSEVTPTADPAALVPTATLTETPTPTVFLPPPTVAPLPTVAIPTSVPVEPTAVVEVQPLPTEITILPPTVIPTDVVMVEGAPEVVVDPNVIPAEATIEVVAPVEIVPTTDPALPLVESPTIEDIPTQTVTVDPAVGSADAGAAGASEDGSPAEPVTDANSIAPAPTEDTPVEGLEPTPIAPEVVPDDQQLPLPTAQEGEPAVPVAPTADLTLMPTTDPALMPTVDSGMLPTTDPGIVPTTDPVLLPTVDPALLPTTEPALVPTLEATLMPTPVPAQLFGIVTLSDAQDHSGIVVMLTSPDGSILQSVTDAVGAFTFPDLFPGNYQITAGAAGYLSRQAEFGLAEAQVVNLPPTSLRVGDTNLDNAIDLSDAALIASNFDSPATVPEADINGDGWIDVKDLALIGADYGQTGPLPWQ